MFGHKPPVPKTVSDDQMQDLKDRALKADPDMGKITHPEAIRRAKLARDQSSKAHWS